MFIYNKYLKIFFSLIIVFVIGSCTDEISYEEEEYYGETEQTVFLYMPWSTNLTPYFRTNLIDLKSSLKNNILQKDRILIFFATNSTNAYLFEYKYKKNNVICDTIKHYDVTAFVTAEGMSDLLTEIKEIAPAKTYSMIFSAHGMGWTPKSNNKAMSFKEGNWINKLPQKTKNKISGSEKKEETIELKTKYLGGSESYRIDISDFAEGVKLSNTKFNYIIFDACFMSSIETIYDLKDITDYIIASPTEILTAGFPYKKIGKYIFGTPNYKGICEEFFNYYNNKKSYGTIALIDCSKIDEMVRIMKKINSQFIFENSNINLIQKFDGFTPCIFYDFGDYVHKLCNDESLINEFNNLLEQMIPSYGRLFTKYFMSEVAGKIKVNNFSGINTSEPSTSKHMNSYKNTSWYKATH